MKRILFLAVLVVGFALTSSSVLATNSVIYSNIASFPSNVPSLGVEAYSMPEIGSQIQLVGTNRTNPRVTILMSSWACQEGSWYESTCATSIDATFTHPITLNVYNVGIDNAPGTLITSVTQTFTMPYRPSTDITNCTGGRWFDGTACFNGKAFVIMFNLSGVNLPERVIVGVAYNTTHHGYAPVGGTGGPYDSLNVGLTGNPTVGNVLPTANDLYQNSSHGGFYCDNGLVGGTGTFRLDAGCWTGYMPGIMVDLPKVSICHLENKKLSKYHRISISVNAQPSHLGHGDGVPGGIVSANQNKRFADDCTLVDRVWTLVDTVIVPSNSSVGVLSNVVLTSGKSYKLESSGTWVNSNNVADTEFASIDGWSTHMDGYNIAPYILGEGEFDLQVDNAFVNWGAYNPANIYTYLKTGTGSNVGLRIFDGDSIFPATLHPEWYGDNQGVLTVNIYELQ